MAKLPRRRWSRACQLWSVCLALVAAGCALRHPDGAGKASWYGPGFRGKPTASGERFRPWRRTAAHRSLPFGSVVKVRRTDTGKTVRVVITDRGPFVKGRVLDLSKGAARRLDMLDAGVVSVEYAVVGCRPRRGNCR